MEVNRRKCLRGIEENLFSSKIDVCSLKIIFRQSHCKTSYLKIENTDLLSSSTTLLAHFFGKIDSFLLFYSSRACGDRREQNSKKESILPNKYVSKFVEGRPKLLVKAWEGVSYVGPM